CHREEVALDDLARPSIEGRLGDCRHEGGSLAQAVSSRAKILYLKASGSSESIRPALSSACGYIRNGSGDSLLPGSFTSCAVLKASQLPSQAPNNVLRAAITLRLVIGRLAGGSSSTTLRTSAGSTGVQPLPSSQASARQCCALVTTSEPVP